MFFRRNGHKSISLYVLKTLFKINNLEILAAINNGYDAEHHGAILISRAPRGYNLIPI